MIYKLQITKVLVVFGFLLSIANYSIDLFEFYTSTDKTSIVFEETENSEQKEKEGSEKDDVKEKDKILQFYEEKTTGLTDALVEQYPEFCIPNISVFLEHKTPPPEHIFNA